MRRLALSACVGMLAIGVESLAIECPRADLTLSNGHIITMDSERRIVSALAVRDGKIEAIGTNPDIFACTGATTKKIDLQGHTGAAWFHRCPHTCTLLGEEHRARRNRCGLPRFEMARSLAC